MSEMDPHLRQSRILELASLPSTDPRRKELENEFALMSAEEHTQWEHTMKETDLLYRELPEVDVPTDLEARLLQVPQTQSQFAPKRRISAQRLRLYAASILILLPLAGYLLWTTPSFDHNPNYQFLAQPAADKVATLAIQTHESPPPLTIASSDPIAVQHALDAALKSYAMPFPAMVPVPKTPLTLQGGGVCTFGPTHAIFTRWIAGATTYTLFQFDGKPFNIPAGFSKAVTTAKTLSHGPYSYRVSIWPGYGNPCTWALVMENSSATDAFD